MNQRFSKREHLCSKKLIEELFSKGRSTFSYPIKLFYLKSTAAQTQGVQVLVSVSKKHFKRAVDRNKIKRLLRESYRKNKGILRKLPEGDDGVMLLGIIYTGKTILPFKELERKIILILRRLNEQDEEIVG